MVHRRAVREARLWGLAGALDWRRQPRQAAYSILGEPAMPAGRTRPIYYQRPYHNPQLRDNRGNPDVCNAVPLGSFSDAGWQIDPWAPNRRDTRAIPHRDHPRSHRRWDGNEGGPNLAAIIAGRAWRRNGGSNQ